MPVFHGKVLRSFVAMVNGRPVSFEEGKEVNFSDLGWVQAGFIEPLEQPFLPSGRDLGRTPTVEFETLEPRQRAVAPRARAATPRTRGRKAKKP